MGSPNKYYSIDFSGKLVTVCEPMILKPGDFTILQNVRYIPNGYGGTTLRGIGGITKFNSNAPTTYTDIKTGYHFVTTQPASSHILVQALDSGGTNGRILDNTTAIAGTGTGDFSATALYTLTNTATGRFNPLPDQSVGFANGYDCVVWGGDEYRVGKFINLDYVSDTFKYDGTELVNNNLTTEYVSIKSVASTPSGTPVEELLLHGNATPLVDSGKSTLTVTATGAVYSTTQKKFGTGSIYFDGTNDKLDVAAHANFNFNACTWTIDCWFKPDNPKDATLVSIVGSGANTDYIQCSLDYTTTTSYYLKMNYVVNNVEQLGTSGLVSSVCIPAGPTTAVSYEWHHAAFTQNAGTVYMFLDGALVGTQALDDYPGTVMPNETGAVVIGADQAGTGNFFNGYIDELRISTVAEYTTAFTPPASEYAGTEYTTIASIYVASTRALSGTKLYIGTANDATSSLYDVKYWNGSAWTSCTTQVDGTSASSKTLAQTGTITWDSTVTTAKPRMLYNTHAYWYLLQFSGVNNTTYPTVYYCTVKAPFQAPTDIFDGVMKYPSLVWRYTSSDDYQDMTTNVLEEDTKRFGGGAGTFMNLNALGTSEYYYVGSVYRLQGVNIVFAGDEETTKYFNNSATTLTVSYWNGSAWTAVSGQIDTTIGGASKNISHHHNGTVTWHSPTIISEFPKAIVNDFPLYYYRFSFSDALDSTVRIDHIQCIPAPKDLKPAKYIFSWQNRTILLNEVSGYQDKIVVSIPYSTSTYNGENAFETRVDDSLMCGTAVHTRYDNSNLEDAIICSKSKTYLMTGSSPENFHISKISDVYGCINPNTMRTCTLTTDQGKREVAIWLSQIGVCMYDGSKIQRIDDDIRDKFTPNHANVITYTDLVNMSSSFNERYNEFILHYPKMITTSIISNGGFDSATTGWSANSSSYATLSSTAGGQSGNCLTLTMTAGTGSFNHYAYQTGTFEIGKSYKLTAYVKSGTAGAVGFTVGFYNSDTSTYYASQTGTTSGSWVQYTVNWVATVTSAKVTLQSEYASGATTLFDTVVITEALSGGWIYNVEYNKWWYMQYTPASASILQCSFPLYDTSGNQYMFSGGSTGFLYRMDNGVSSDTNNFTRTICFGDFPMSKQADVLFTKTDLDYLVLYLKTDASADSMTVSHYGDTSTTPTTLKTSLQTSSGYGVKEIRTITSNTLATQHVLHKFSISMTADDTAIGLEPLLMSIRYRDAEFKDV